MVREAPARIHDLLEYGVPFDRDLEGKLVQSREAAHSENRVVRVGGDRAGKAIMEALIAKVRKTTSIRVLESYVVEALISNGRYVSGVIARADAGRSKVRVEFPARAVVIATGGVGHLFAVTTNPSEARGGGCGIAAKAGAIIADPEFVQFHPTAINIGRDPAPLATEALRGEGAHLDQQCRRALHARHPQGRRTRPARHRGTRNFRRSPGRARRIPRLHQNRRRAFRDRVPHRLRLLPLGGHRPERSNPSRSSPPSITTWAASSLTPMAEHRWTASGRQAKSPPLVCTAQTAWPPIHCSEAVVFAARIADNIQGLIAVAETQ